MLRFPKAKINIGLYVTSKRQDGYHTIESIFYPIPIADALEAVKADHSTCQLSIHGLTVAGDLENNLIFKAWKLLHDNYGIGGVDAWLIKQIPMGAGLGGGSGNGAHMLLLLNDLFELHIDTDTLETFAAKLGSDCPFFIRETPAYVTGRGDVMEPIDLDLSGKWLTLIHPGVHVGTKEAYSLITPIPAENDLRQLASLPLNEWGAMAINHFERPVAALHPVVREALSILQERGATFASMSGSGSAVYGIFERDPGAFGLPAGWTVQTCQL